MSTPRILIVEDDGNYLEIYRRCLQSGSYELFSARSSKKALELLKKQKFDIVLTDLKMLGGKEVFSGFDVLEQAMAIDPEIQVIVITGYGGVEHALRAMRSGAYDFIIKDGDIRRKIMLTVQSALEVRLLKMELLGAKPKDDINPESDRILGNSSAMQEISGEITRAASNDLNILIYGESGTGKKLIAQTIHRQSRRKNGPFFVIDCGDLSETTKDIVFYGREAQGSRDGAAPHRGKFELANGGTIFLDGVNYLKHDYQHNLINILTKQRVRRIGSGDPIALDVRVIASIEVTGEALLEKQRFRRNLLDILNEMVISVPPLRDRIDGSENDVLLLAAMFLKRHGGDRVVDISSQARELLNQYHYPGNVKELENIIKEALVRCDSDIIKPKHLKIKSEQNRPTSEADPVLRSEAILFVEGSEQAIHSDSKRLRQNLQRSFSVAEIREICFDLGLDYDNLAGSKKAEKIIDLLGYLDRRQMVDQLLKVCRELRPHLSW